jgi:hypothetical protein
VGSPRQQMLHCPQGTLRRPVRVGPSGGLGRENYDLGQPKTSARRVQEMESLGYFPVGFGRAADVETTLQRWVSLWYSTTFLV